MPLLAAKAVQTSVQWWTLAWIVGAAAAATLIIAAIVVVSRRPKSMEHGMAEFSRSLQAVAPTARASIRASTGGPRPPVGKSDVRRRRGASDV